MSIVRRLSRPVAVLVTLGLASIGVVSVGGPAQAATAYSVGGLLSGSPVGGGAAVPLPEVEVEMYSAAGSYVGYAFTESDGTWSITQDRHGDNPVPLAAGTYTLKFNCDADPLQYDCNHDYVYEYLGHARSTSTAATFTLSDASPTSTENFTLAHGAKITGTVTDAGGTPLSNATINASTPGTYEGVYAYTKADGTYSIDQLQATDTQVYASYYPSNPTNSHHNQKFYNTKWWNNSLTAAGATQLAVPAGSVTPGISFSLTEAAAVRGRVVDSAGNGVAYMGYVPWFYDPATQHYLSPRYGPIQTDADGYFAFSRQGSGSAKLSFSDSQEDDGQGPFTRSPFNTRWWDAASSFSASAPIDFSGESTQKDLGNIVVTPHTGGITFLGAGLIQAEELGDPALEVDGIAISPGTADYSLSWYRDGVAIAGATDYTYTPVAADDGTVLTAKITATLAGQTTKSIVTPGYDLRHSFASTTQPVITSAATTGAVLSLTTTPVWTPAPTSTSYQWFRNGIAISGATSASYTTVTGDAGASILLKVTAVKSGYVNDAQSSNTVVPTAPPAVVAGSPTISGSAVVGSELAATPGTWTPSDATLSYQWLRAGTVIGGATGSTYTASGADYGSTLSVRVSGTKDGYVSATQTSAATATVAAGTLTAGSVTISGTPSVGLKLTADHGTWAPAITYTYKYQWYAAAVAISGATSSTYTLTSASYGKTVTVKVTASSPGYSTKSATSTGTTAVAKGTLTNTKLPSISGTAKSGSTLTAHVGTWSPSTSLTFSYQWLRSTATGTPVAISGATKSTYKLTSKDKGKYITLAVTAKKTAYTSLKASSAKKKIA